MSRFMSMFVWIIFATLSMNAVSAMADQRFVDNGDGTVTDRKMGLMWAKNDNQKDISWQQAQSWAEKTFEQRISGKYTNWRLPTVEELQSLYLEDSKYEGYETDCGFRVKIVPQIKISCILIWSSETALNTPLAFNFNLGNPFLVDLHDSTGCRALPVRELKD